MKRHSILPLILLCPFLVGWAPSSPTPEEIKAERRKEYFITTFYEDRFAGKGYTHTLTGEPAFLLVDAFDKGILNYGDAMHWVDDHEDWYYETVVDAK